MILTALHGFLGRPRDWTELFQGHPLEEILCTEDLYTGEILELSPWTESFNAKYTSSENNVLLGYSLGGRLALHALTHKPELWSGAVIVSAHLGLKSLSERQQRHAIDEQWASRFEADEWEDLMRDWSAREVFKHDLFHFKRHEKDYSRARLAASLRQWSLARQDDLQNIISQLPMPILWVAGENDLTYRQQAARLQLYHPLSEIWIVPETGHRVPWQCPQQFLLKISHFLHQIANSQCHS